MLRKRYQALLIHHLKEQIRKNINSDNPDEDLRILSEPIASKAFFVSPINHRATNNTPNKTKKILDRVFG